MDKLIDKWKKKNTEVILFALKFYFYYVNK